MKWTMWSLALLASGCGYQYYAGPVRPVATQADVVLSVADDGTVTYTRERLEVKLRPMSAAELDRQFQAQSTGQMESTNPYTFTGSAPATTFQEQSRFMVFWLGVKNYAYPKVKIDPSRMVVRANNGREYWSLGFEQLDAYHRAYALGYRGNEYARYQERRDILRRTLYRGDEVFSGQETGGYVVFPALHPDVTDFEVAVDDVVLRFDYANEPTEAVDVRYRFTRDTGRIYGDGRVAINPHDTSSDN
ncbi:MAG: hypothetical protein WDA75_07625 [Candidatus Latescibacterota bacterium]